MGNKIKAKEIMQKNNVPIVPSISKITDNKIIKDFIDKKGFINTLPKSILKDIMVDGFFAAKLIKNYEI